MIPRACHQLTSGSSAHFPLYYCVPSHTADGRFLVVHRQTGRAMQLCRIDVETGKSRPLTHGSTPRLGWDNWCQPDTTGVYTHLSALNQRSNEVWWLESPADQPDLLQLLARNVATLEAREILELPGRLPIGQSAFSPDGKRFAFIHADHDRFRSTRAAFEPKGWAFHQAWRRVTPCLISLVDTETGERRDIADLDFHVHHVLFADNNHILVNHCPDGNGMWTMRIDEGPESMRILRPEDDSGRVCHQVVTRRGIDYEVFQQFTGGHQNRVGRLEWPGGRWTEVPLEIPG